MLHYAMLCYAMRLNTLLCRTPNVMPLNLETNSSMPMSETPRNAALYFFYTSEAADPPGRLPDLCLFLTTTAPAWASCLGNTNRGCWSWRVVFEYAHCLCPRGNGVRYTSSWAAAQGSGYRPRVRMIPRVRSCVLPWLTRGRCWEVFVLVGS